MKTVQLKALLFLLILGVVKSIPLGRVYRILPRSPIDQSSEIWATVIANVALLMTLVGEHNTNEFLRVSSSRDQLLLMAVTPLGLFSIVICVIRLSGPRLLRGIIGRESERVSEALVEMTSLSMAPASSVYTSQAVEIEPSDQRDRDAFVCGHVKHIGDVAAALRAFKSLLQTRMDKEAQGKGSDDRDSEIVLGIRNNSLTAVETRNLVEIIITKESVIEEPLLKRLKTASASISFRSTGISPTQTAPNNTSFIEGSQVRNVLVGLLFFVAMCGLQLGGWKHGNTRSSDLQTLIMGLLGYISVVVFTSMLLNIMKGGVRIERLGLDPVFEQPMWTYSDSLHTEHRTFTPPPGRSFVQAAPASPTQSIKQRRKFTTTATCAGLILS